MAIQEKLSEEESALWAILSDPSGLDQAEFLFWDHETNAPWRAWPFQWPWFRDMSPLQVDQSARSVGKTLSIMLRAFAFPFIHPGQEMLITAPELVHLNPITGLIENKFRELKLGRYMLPQGRNQGITHRPFEMQFLNGARIFGRIPNRDGRGVKGCVEAGVLILTRRGLTPVEQLVPGDEVYTHRQRWREVVRLDSYIEEDAWRVDGQGAVPFVVSEGHRFYVRFNEAKNPNKQRRQLGMPTWCLAPDLEEKPSYWASPSVFNDIDPVISLPLRNSNEKDLPMTSDFWWLVGRYLADGYLDSQKVYDGWRKHEPPEERINERRVRYRIKFVVVPGVDQEDIILRLKKIGLRATVNERDHSSADVVEVSNTPWGRWLEEHFGKNAHKKRLPVTVLSLSENDRRSLLDGYLAGDGGIDKRERVTAGSASKSLIIGMKLLAQSLGMVGNVSVIQPDVSEIRGVKLKQKPRLSWRLQIPARSYAIQEDDWFWTRVNSSEQVGPTRVYNPVVEEDHSYVGDGMVCHNSHPLWLEQDESSDYPEPGWTELTETLKRGHVGAIWRSHGVTRGVRDSFYKITQPESGWRVHRVTAMHRPTWTDEERQEKIRQYGSADDPDYRRNIVGSHGDSENRIFVLSRLMGSTDTELASFYNTTEYYLSKITAEMLNDVSGNIYEFLQFPEFHKQNSVVWIGMDVGYVSDPSEILVFAEVNREPEPSLFKLLSRIHLKRIAHPDQVRFIGAVIDFYQPKAFTMDATGNGLPLFQQIQHEFPQYLDFIKGYNFSAKILVDFDKRIEVNEYSGDLVKESGVERNVQEYGVDVLRDMVDKNRILLPFDRELLGEFQGRTYHVVRDNVSQYGKKSFNRGSFHTLDAATMAVLGYVQTPIETFIENLDHREPVYDLFLEL